MLEGDGGWCVNLRTSWLVDILPPPWQSCHDGCWPVLNLADGQWAVVSPLCMLSDIKMGKLDFNCSQRTKNFLTFCCLPAVSDDSGILDVKSIILQVVSEERNKKYCV